MARLRDEKRKADDEVLALRKAVGELERRLASAEDKAAALTSENAALERELAGPRDSAARNASVVDKEQRAATIEEYRALLQELKAQHQVLATNDRLVVVVVFSFSTTFSVFNRDSPVYRTTSTVFFLSLTMLAAPAAKWSV